MRRTAFIIIASMILISCAPVLRQGLVGQSVYNFTLSDVAQNPGFYQGKTLMFGGVIAKTTLTKEGSLIEALYVPVDSRGYHQGIDNSAGRFLALFPGSARILDPMIFQEKREVTIAGEYIGTRKGMIDEIEYTYPLFKIIELYLWEEGKEDYYRYPRHRFEMGYPWHYGYGLWWED
ncbi:MAG: Slp family lipoprotein [Nitrospirae bacterium]|nr:Slp family lipoprotein [Nitrospirota bacterium]